MTTLRMHRMLGEGQEEELLRTRTEKDLELMKHKKPSQKEDLILQGYYSPNAFNSSLSQSLKLNSPSEDSTSTNLSPATPKSSKR